MKEYFLLVKTSKGSMVRRFLKKEHRNLAMEIFYNNSKSLDKKTAYLYIKAFINLYKKYPTYPLYIVP